MKMLRYVYFFLYIAIFRFTPETYRPYALFFPAIRRWLVGRFADECGENVKVKYNADISPHIRIGNNAELGQRCVIYGGVSIGDDVLMGPGVRLITRNHSVGDVGRPIREQGDVFAPIIIEDDVWLGANVVVLPGVTIGAHSVIGAGSVVTKSCAPYSIMGGVPAKFIKSRKEDE